MKALSVKLTAPRILTINGGSSSIKFALFEVAESLRRILEGRVERNGLQDAIMRVKGLDPVDTFSPPVTAPDHTAAVSSLIDWIAERLRSRAASTSFCSVVTPVAFGRSCSINLRTQRFSG